MTGGTYHDDRFGRVVVAAVRAPDGWTLHSVKPYVGDTSYLVWEFVKGDECVTLYGDVLSVQDAIPMRPEFAR